MSLPRPSSWTVIRTHTQPTSVTHLNRSDAIDAWVAGTVQRALAYATTLVRSRPDAEDIVQDCYGRLLAKSSRYDLVNDGRKLLFRAITNACINWTTRRAPVVNLEPGVAEARFVDERAETCPEQQAMTRELEQAVGTALAELPVNQRAVVELSSMGYSLVEIAEMLEITQGNARVILHRARQSLAVRLRPHSEENVT
jgi:RNA polymerase sigma factor (sigma-70 family)